MRRASAFEKARRCWSRDTKTSGPYFLHLPSRVWAYYSWMSMVGSRARASYWIPPSDAGPNHWYGTRPTPTALIPGNAKPPGTYPHTGVPTTNLTTTQQRWASMSNQPLVRCIINMIFGGSTNSDSNWSRKHHSREKCMAITAPNALTEPIQGFSPSDELVIRAP